MNESQQRKKLSEHLKRFDLFGWEPRLDLSDDENFMDMVMLITRNSFCLQGHMGCVIIDHKICKRKENGITEESESMLYDRILDSLIGVSTNSPLFSNLDSDIHAEIGALGQASKRGNKTDGCTAYITMPPCKRCFAALLSSGIIRIVSRQAAPKSILDVARKHGIEMVDFSNVAAEQNNRINQLTNMGTGSTGKKTSDQIKRIEESKKRKKLEKEARKEKARLKSPKKPKTMIKG
mmetsp:Transcript_20773/g.19993  ORF Transcript_20773/g.19993 Transcript_20773/m.19993 type:complete len:236 (-) Transcript_20773:44-751(-)